MEELLRRDDGWRFVAMLFNYSIDPAATERVRKVFLIPREQETAAQNGCGSEMVRVK
ncbi:MAG: hypothetical protein ABSH49_11320 [Bryobacteraceae bacterium]